MHRLNRCLTTAAAIAAVACADPFVTANAQQPLFPPLAQQSETAPAGHAKAVTHTAPRKRRHKRRVVRRVARVIHKSAPVQAPLPPTDPKDRLSTRLRLGDGVRMWRPSRKQIGVAYAPGGSDASISGAFKFVVDRAKLRKYLAGTAPYILRSPVNARAAVDSASATNVDAQQVPAKIIPEINGASLDLDAATDLVARSIEGDPSTIHVVLPVKIKPARIIASQLQGVNSRIGYFVTRFNPGDVGRTQTVRLAINIIDGAVVPPQGVFSVNHTVGERTAERGFGKGHVFINGKMEVQQGGGMCQVATTLFNAAMLADLKIVERHQHVRTIPYADPGRDATVYWGQKDLKIQNLTSAPLYISYKTTRSHAIVSLFGAGAPGRKVTLVSHYKKLGERHYTGVFYRVVTNPDGTVVKDKPFYSAYKWTPALDYSR
ncbi:hypothetical protein CCAX7_34670 [Capsulimonas corticalis]|uniref:Uncharacterized protein n=1 Tax=Capsulimonas corticalis TaxID=2219043 RepID=A0A402CY86_9BACT|nr:VanW family protein [Capsulimonas corticalis]BDI31416.1 hypothetical protein CCAX7_34670 [Capsulimonas corticalis]